MNLQGVTRNATGCLIDDLPPDLESAIRDFLSAELVTDEARLRGINAVRTLLHALSPNMAMPVDLVRWVPIEKVEANDYNPNHVAKFEMTLLLRSIAHDGYTQPVVTVYDPDRDMYVIVDGFHRFSVMKMNAEVLASCHGYLPIVVLEKSITERMAATVRHNRARGKHSVQGMSAMVFQMLDQGLDDASICNELGMEPEELVRLKHITGFSKLFKDTEYNRAWTTRAQIRLRANRDAGGDVMKDKARGSRSTVAQAARDTETAK